MKKLLERYGDLFRYLVAGGLTTLLSILSFALFNDFFGIHYTVSNLFSWVLSVTFAFVLSKWYVFQSKDKGKKSLFKESAGFFASRLATLAVEEILMMVLISLLQVPELVSKIICNVIVVILNYVFSKFLVFRSK